MNSPATQAFLAERDEQARLKRFEQPLEINHIPEPAPERTAVDGGADRAANAMSLHGGSFIRQIGAAYFAADAENRERLVYAFFPEFQRYAVLAAQGSRFTVTA